ncbi:MAG: hypothetical protein BGO43_10685 [Gammaproteobacteria bacterium 39-13]|nr:peptidoglycan editing factor PgeF [Gammaproteobacteria bacterium]OJV86156.1 MAG: hypothetical protein BGO43_10685 [Gammaproteobacteria bacterium 39-13]
MVKGIEPNWPAPSWVRAVTTTREGGVSQGAYQSLNLALHVNDNPEKVVLNRLKLNQRYNLQHEPAWLEQTHSTRVVEIKGDEAKSTLGIDADGAWTKCLNVPCVVLTADCLPLLLCDTKGTVVSAVHCGWRGILNGIIENAVQAIKPHTQGEIIAWLGPAIGPDSFEVGEEVRQQFMQHDRYAQQAFKPKSSGKWLGDMYQLAKNRLHQSDIKAIYGGDFCTYTDAERFYSFRRDKDTGRMATLIWLAHP